MICSPSGLLELHCRRSFSVPLQSNWPRKIGPEPGAYVARRNSAPDVKVPSMYVLSEGIMVQTALKYVETAA